jgi:hypothetical protein
MAFAETTDIVTRLMRQVSSEEELAAEMLLDLVSREIVDVVGKASEDDIDADAVKGICIEAVCRELASPVGAESTSETIGAYSYRVGYRETGGTYLTDNEKLSVRNAVYGTLSGSSTPRALADRLIDLAEGRDVDEVEV